MQFIASYALVAFAIRVTYALPQQITTTAEEPSQTSITVSFSYDPLPTDPLAAVAASPFPASPTTNEFKYLNYKENNDDDKKNRQYVHDGFLDFAPVLKAVTESLDDTDDKTYDRWFQAKVLREDKDDLDGRTYVKGVFTQIYSTSDDTPTEAVTGFTCVNNDFRDNCPKGTKAYTVAPSFHFCAEGLAQTTKASENKCDDLGDALSEKMNSITGTIIHELMHQRKVGDTAPDSVGHILDVDYSAATCQRLNKGPKKNKTFVNADSYKWFALNAYYNKVCDKAFKDAAVTQEDFDAGNLELLSSPDYSEVDSSGSLAGV